MSAESSGSIAKLFDLVARQNDRHNEYCLETNTTLAAMTATIETFRKSVEDVGQCSKRPCDLAHRVVAMEKALEKRDDRKWDVQKIVITSLMPLIVTALIWLLVQYNSLSDRENLQERQIAAIKQMEDAIIRKLDGAAGGK